MTELRPQTGQQEKFLKCSADIAIYGGAAGAGKTYGMLLYPLRYIHNPLFGGVIFRRTTPQIKAEGGIWDESEMIYPLLGAYGLKQQVEWRFPSGAKLKFAHMEHQKNRFDWQSSQIPFIGFEEICQFAENQFWYMLSRNRSTSGVQCRIRGTCNPDPDSFVARLIEWWINPETGYPITERSGVVRWFARVGDELAWGATRKELVDRLGEGTEPKSFTFIHGNIFDNPALLQKDPTYLANLKALPLVDRLQLLQGNWHVRPAAGLYFKRPWFGVVDAAPKDIVVRVRYWDRAATPISAANPDPDATVGLLMSKDRNGIFYIEDVQKMFVSPHAVDQAMINTAAQDGPETVIGYMQDPGSAGVGEAQATAAKLAGYQLRFATATGDKQTRAKPVSSQAEAGNIKLVSGKWNHDYLRILENFPEAKHDDEVDATSGAFEICANPGFQLFVA